MSTLEQETTVAVGRRRARRRAAHDWLVSIGTLLLGLAIVAGLTRYNLRGDVRFVPYPFASNAEYWNEYLLVNITCLVFVPFLAIFCLFRERAGRFGFRPPAAGRARVAWFLLLVMAPCMAFAASRPEFRFYYPIQKEAAFYRDYFLFYELTYGFYLFCWEFFYRGFLTFGLARRFGFVAAIMLQSLAFGVMHWGKPLPEFYGSFVAAAALGWLAVRTRSFLPGYFLHWAVSMGFDLVCIHGRPGALF